MKLEISRYEDLKLLTHIIDIPINNIHSLRIFQDFSCKWTQDPIYFNPWTITTKGNNR